MLLRGLPLGRCTSVLDTVKVKAAQSCPTLVTLWTAARQAPLSMGLSRQAYWSGLLFPSPGDLLDPGIELESSALIGGLLHYRQILLLIEPPGKPLVT